MVYAVVPVSGRQHARCVLPYSGMHANIRVISNPPPPSTHTRVSLPNWLGTASARVKRSGLSPWYRTPSSAPIKGKCSGNGASDGLGIRAYGSKDGLTISTRLSASRDRIYWTFWHGASGGYARESWHPATPSSWRPWCRSWSMPCLPRPRRTTRFPRKVLLVLKQS